MYCWKVGCMVPNACRAAAYSIHVSQLPLCCMIAKPLEVRDVNHKWSCHIHGSGGCMGHIGHCSTDHVYTIPVSLMTKTINFQSLLYSLHDRLASGAALPACEYQTYVLSILRGKKGAVHCINTMSVQGAIHMVIAPDPSLDAGSVSIPEWVATSVCIPYLNNGMIKTRCVHDGDHALLVRQLCMWSGGIQAVVVRMSSDVNSTSKVDCSMRLPMQMCAPYAADYDGDKMTLFLMYDELSIAECQAFKWDYQSITDEFISGYNELCTQRTAPHDTIQSVRAAAIATTTCMLDINKKLKITSTHERHMPSKSSFIRYNLQLMSAMDFASRAGHGSMKSGAMKASHQSDVGALSTRCSKCGAERVYLTQSSNVCTTVLCQSWMLISERHLADSVRTGWFGESAQRAVSKLTAAVMQVTLKVKYGSNVSSLSPILSVLQGSDEWLSIHVVANESMVHIHDNVNDQLQSTDTLTYSIAHIAQQTTLSHDMLINNLIKICELECNFELTSAERLCLTALIKHRVSMQPPSKHEGVQIDTIGDSTGLRWLVSACSQYCNQHALPHVPYAMTPASLIECTLLSNFNSIRSILI